MHLGAYCFKPQCRDIFTRWPSSKVLKMTVIWQLFTLPAISYFQISLEIRKDSDNVFSVLYERKKKNKEEIVKLLPQSYERWSWKSGSHVGSITNSLNFLQKRESEVSPEA